MTARALLNFTWSQLDEEDRETMMPAAPQTPGEKLALLAAAGGEIG